MSILLAVRKKADSAWRLKAIPKCFRISTRVDYWAVDFAYEIKREIIRVPVDLGPKQQKELPGMGKPQMALQAWEERWTGEYIFESEWLKEGS